MAKFEITFRAYQTRTVEASTIEAAYKKAYDELDDNDWDSVAVVDSDVVDADDGELAACIRGNACAKCSHYHIEQHMCDYENVPEGKTPFWHCCLYDYKEGAE